MNNLTKQHYWSQIGSSNKRGVKFDLTYEQWLEIWESSGFAHLRGRGKGKYCMARHNDIGPYAVGNVSIMPISQNASDAHKGKPKPYTNTAEYKQKVSKGIRRTQSVSQCPYCSKQIKGNGFT